MTELLTAAQMKAIEQAAIDSGEVTGLELMERAGRGVVEAILEEWPAMALTSHKAVVLCGPGNNGGDGFVVARLLKERGWEVEVFLYGDEGKLPPDAKVNCVRWREMGEVANGEDNYPRQMWSANIVVDAIFGTGLKRPISGKIFEVITSTQETGDHGVDLPMAHTVNFVSVDLPSGLNSDNGNILNGVMNANLTVTFHSEKIGHRLGDGSMYCGKIVVKDIGLSKWHKHSDRED